MENFTLKNTFKLNFKKLLIFLNLIMSRFNLIILAIFSTVRYLLKNFRFYAFFNLIIIKFILIMIKFKLVIKLILMIIVIIKLILIIIKFILIIIITIKLMLILLE